MPKIVFCFAGTGDEGDDYAKKIEDSNDFDDKDVIRIYLRGCQHANVGGGGFMPAVLGGGMVFPDLEVVANKILNAFNKNEKMINIKKLQDELGSAICRVEGPKLTEARITDIGLQGFSRGAVTTFAVAKKLDVLGIPIDIIANQPVPGQITEASPGSLFAKYHDLSKCQNIRSATTLLATHNLENGFVHNTFFQQMVARFNPKTNENTWLMPYQEHFSSSLTKPVSLDPSGKAPDPLERPDPASLSLVPLHIRNQFETCGYSAVKEMDKGYTSLLIKNLHKSSGLYFTPPEFSQKVFGADLASMPKDPVYLEVMQDRARKILNKTPPLALSDDQAGAIVIISRMATLSKAEKDKFMDFVLQDNDNGRKFTQIINKTDGVMEFLERTTVHDTSNKSSLIEQHSIKYKKDVFTTSHEYLSKAEPSAQDKVKFIKDIDNANKVLDDSALKVDRNLGRKAMQVVTTFLLTCTVVGMLANAYNFAKTGNWSFFSNTRSSQVVNAFSKGLVANTTSEDCIDKTNNIKTQFTRLRASAQVGAAPKPEEEPLIAPVTTPQNK